MEQISSWEADGYSYDQEIPRSLLIAKFHYDVHMIPPLDPVLSAMNPLHILITSHLFSSLQVFRLNFCIHFSSPHACDVTRDLILIDLATVIMFGSK